MTRKDEKDTERPHYYSQFWLDVAAGRREIGAPKTDESSDADEVPEPTAHASRGSRATAAALADGHRSSRVSDLDEEDFATDQPGETGKADQPGDYNAPELEEDTFASDLNDEDIPDIPFSDLTDEEDLEAELPQEEEEFVDDEDYFDDEDEEEEEEDEWASRGRKKPKPGRQTKAPKPSPKKPKRGGRF